MNKTLFILPWFGPYPVWMDQWVANMERLKPLGYDYVILSNLKLFHERVEKMLGKFSPIIPRTGKVWDYRPMLGYLYPELVKGYSHWGHTDFDCVYGDVNRYRPEGNWEIWSNHGTYICGPWTLYLNCPYVNELFRKSPAWQDKLNVAEPTGWAETEFTRVVNNLCQVVYTQWQTKDFSDMSHLAYNNGKLYDGGEEIMMAHFRRTKVYPIDRYVV